MRAERDLAPLALPATGDLQTDEYKDGFWIRNHGKRAAFRGANWGDGAPGRAGFALGLSVLPSHRYSNVGFRAALSLEVL